MKKLLALTLSLGSIGFMASATEAKSAARGGAATTIAANSSAPQMRGQYGRRRGYNRRVRTVIRTRLVRRGRYVFRETYQIRYLPNGRTQTRLISRVRVR